MRLGVVKGGEEAINDDEEALNDDMKAMVKR